MPYEQINDKSSFLAMSASGVLQHNGPEVGFTSLEKWEEEYNMYCTLMKIRTFFYFRLWKAFYMWRKGIIFRKNDKARKHLESNLFILNPMLRQSLLDIKHMCYCMEQVSFTNGSCFQDYYLFYFIEEQVPNTMFLILFTTQTTFLDVQI